MFKNKDIEKFSKTGIQDMFTYEMIDVDKLSEERKIAWGLDEECNTLTRADVDKLVELGEIDYCDVSYDYMDWDDVAYYEFIHELVKKANNYLVYLPHSTWRGSSGCGIVNSLEDAFYRGYECSQCVKGVTKGNKAVLLREAHHDVPTGHDAVIIALTDKEYSMLSNSDFETMEKFALKYLEKLNKKSYFSCLVNDIQPQF